MHLFALDVAILFGPRDRQQNNRPVGIGLAHRAHEVHGVRVREDAGTHVVFLFILFPAMASMNLPGDMPSRVDSDRIQLASSGRSMTNSGSRFWSGGSGGRPTGRPVGLYVLVMGFPF
jgi:hypothetical protein